MNKALSDTGYLYRLSICGRSTSLSANTGRQQAGAEEHRAIQSGTNPSTLAAWDLIIAGPSGRSVVQVKRYSGNVGVDAVREAAAARAHYRTRGAIVLTNSFFTYQAVTLARSNQVELWDRNTLVRLASKNRALSPPAAPAVFGLELASGMAVIAKFLISASFTSTRRRHLARRRRR